MVSQPSFFSNPPGENIFADLFETDPLGQQALFQSTLPLNTNPEQQRQFSSLFQPTFNAFLGQLGQQVRQGQAPSLSFSEHLRQNFNPQRELLRLPTRSGSGPTIFRL